MAKKRITNTSSEIETREGALGQIAVAAVLGPGAAIELQEKLGQSELAAAKQLPFSGVYPFRDAKGALTEFMSAEERKAIKPDPVWETLGFKIIGPSKDDPLFVDVKFPAGWKIEAREDHAMYSTLRDDKGRERADIFYKAAFYDRKAHIRLIAAVKIETNYTGKKSFATQRYTVEKHGVEIFTTASIKATEALDFSDRAAMDKWRAEHSKIQAEAEAWLDKNYPDHENVLAYWD